MPGEEEKQEQQKQENGTVSLSKEEYTQMITNMNTMKATIEEFVRESAEKDARKYEEERTKAEQERQRQEQAEKKSIDLDLLSNKQLASIIFNEVDNRIGKPPLQMISLMAVKDEKRDLEKMLSKQGENLDDYEEDVIQVASEKPSLSLKEAYEIVKQRRSQKANEEQKKKEQQEKDKKEAENANGEKPGSGKFSPGGKLDILSASERAFKDLKDQFPSE